VIDFHSFQQIRQLHDVEGLNAAQIAQSLGLHRQTVSKWITRPRYEPRAAPPESKRPSKLDAFKPAILRLIQSHPYTGSQLLSRLRHDGYVGGYSILKEYLRTVRPKQAPAFLTLRFVPGQCAQVDWGSWGSIRVGNTRRALSFFVMVLCWSRRMYVEFTLCQKQEHWLACHRNAFEYFGQVAAEVMCDNPKTAVLSHPLGGPPVFNPAYFDLAGHYGFEIKPCGPRKGNEKGRVEAGVAYVKKNFLAGRELTELAAINAEARLWLDTVANVRVHGETHRSPMEMFAEERAALKPLPAHPYDCAATAPVRVSNRCRVTVDTNRYSVPPRCASGQLTLKLYPGRLLIFERDQLVAEHVRSYDRYQDIEWREHTAGLIHDRQQARWQRVLLRFLGLTAHAAAYHEQLAERRLNPRHHVQKIVALSEIYGVEAVGRALEDAHDLGAYSCEYIANLLEQRRRFLPEAGALHLTRQSDMLELDLPAPDLSLYEPKTS
jgi:transposase